MAADQPERVEQLASTYAEWADRCGVRPWEELPLAKRGTPGNEAKK